MVFGDRIPATKDKERTVPLNDDDPTAEGNLSDEEYAAQLAAFAAEHPMSGPSADQYTLLDEEGRNGDPR